jgi:CDP-glucose 4,6-dehydratase
MVQIITNLVGRPDLEPIILDEAQNEIPDQYLASDKANRVLDWRPEFSLEEGLLRTIDWYRDYLTIV